MSRKPTPTINCLFDTFNNTPSNSNRNESETIDATVASATVLGVMLISCMYNFKMLCVPCVNIEKHNKKKSETDGHHEQLPNVQNMFSYDVKSLISVFEEVGNPFADTSEDTKQIMPDHVKAAVEFTKYIGIAQFHDFVSERIHGNTTAFNDVILKNNLPLFNYI